MHPSLLLTFQEVTGLPKETILHECKRLWALDGQTILEFYMTYARFPNVREAVLIETIGVTNYNSLRINGIDVC